MKHLFLESNYMHKNDTANNHFYDCVNVVYKFASQFNSLALYFFISLQIQNQIFF